MAQLLREITTRDTTVVASRRNREDGAYALPLVCYIGTLSVYVACVASYIKIPVDSAYGSVIHFQNAGHALDYIEISTRALKSLTFERGPTSHVRFST